jgi:hemerythrin
MTPRKGKSVTTNDNLHPIFRDIDVEHAEMRTLLASVHRSFTDRSQSVTEVTSMLDSFIDFLKAHFVHEDEGGFFTQITEQSPRLSERAEAVRTEHSALLTECKNFRALADKGNIDDAWWNDLTAAFLQLSKHLMQHEHREQDLLQESFNDEIGTGD